MATYHFACNNHPICSGREVTKALLTTNPNKVTCKKCNAWLGK